LDSTTSIPEGVLSSTLVFRVGDVLYGCDVRETQEIIPLSRMTRLPGAPAYVRGLINVRGTIVTVLDLGLRLNPGRAPSDEGSVLLVRHRERLVGMVVDDVLDVRALAIDGAARTTDREPSAIVAGVAMVENGSVVVLDLQAVITQVLLS
jgi:purine-binding chemotaxis protein CheW